LPELVVVRKGLAHLYSITGTPRFGGPSGATRLNRWSIIRAVTFIDYH